MKKLFLCCLILLCVALNAAQRKIDIQGIPEKVTKIEIVKGNNRPLINYAAREMQTFLKEAMGTAPEIKDTPTPGAYSLILGACELATQAGVNLKVLPDEGFYIIRQGNQIFIAGNDDARMSPDSKSFFVEYKRGTLTGVYDFLERFADARFFFTGECGTVVPAKKALYLPAKIDIMDFPDMYYRHFSMYGKRHYYGNLNTLEVRGVYLPRMREMERRLLFCHGLNGLDLPQRFAKSHPEYFALREDGLRYSDPKMPHTGQLCYNSGVREVIYQDLKALFTGQNMKERGIKNYYTYKGYGCYSIMPQDSFYWCKCDKCQKICKGNPYAKENLPILSEFMFKFFKELSDRLTKEGIPHQLTTMSYAPYKLIPSFSLPKELLIQVAVNGKGGNTQGDKNDTALLKDWYEKTGNKVTAWTYAMGKHGNKVLPGVPPVMFRHAANFIKTNRKYLAGVYFESETEHFLFNYLNYYVVQRLMWNNDLDVEALLDDHFRSMYGKGAPYMAEFFTDLETNWSEKILGNTVDTPLGPVASIPSDLKIWSEIYSPEKIKHYNQLFDKALAATKGDAGATKRLKFIRKELFGYVEETANRFHQMQSGLDFWVARCPGSVWLRPFVGEVNNVNTKISLRKEGDNLIVRADCEEPLIKDIKANCTKNGDPKLFTDSVVEIMLNPSGDRKTIFQYDVNANGALTRYYKGKKNDEVKKDTLATAKAGKTANGWWAEVTIPLKELGSDGKTPFPANFTRNRAINGIVNNDGTVQWSMWSLYPGTKQYGFHAMDTWGKISFDPEKGNLMKNSSLELNNVKDDGRPQNWNFWDKPNSKISLDNKVFISGGRSMKFENTQETTNCIGYKHFPVKAGHKYRFSYFLKTENLEGPHGAGTWIAFADKGQKKALPVPTVKIRGTNPWHRISCEFVAPDCTGDNGYDPVLGLWVWSCKGTAWFDEIRLEEIQ